MSAEIIAFAPAQRRIVPIAAEHSAPETSPPRDVRKSLRQLGDGSDPRRDRKERWRHAELKVTFLQAQLDFVSWCEIAQERGVAEALQLKAFTNDDRMAAAELLHKATAALLLTPAPDRAALNLKRCRVARGGLFALGYATSDEVKRSIAEDAAYLAANPPRRKRQEG